MALKGGDKKKVYFQEVIKAVRGNGAENNTIPHDLPRSFLKGLWY